MLFHIQPDLDDINIEDTNDQADSMEDINDQAPKVEDIVLPVDPPCPGDSKDTDRKTHDIILVRLFDSTSVLILVLSHR